MPKNKFNVISWDKAIHILKQQSRFNNGTLLELLTDVSILLKKENLDYVYHAQLEYGEKVIDGGGFCIDDFEIIGNEYRKSKKDFYNDILYSKCPLTLVLSNYIEIYTDNVCNSESYAVPLSIVNPGSFYGITGLLDYLSGFEDNRSSRDWFARAGMITYSISFPFHRSLVTDYLNCTTDFEYLTSMDLTNENILSDLKKNFIRQNLEGWFAEIVYIPKHFFEKVSDITRVKALNALYNIVWNQSGHLRNPIFEETTIYNLISSSKYKFKHSKLFLNNVYKYLFDIGRGTSLVMKPILDNENVINKAVKNFIDTNEGYFSLKNAKKPVSFMYSPFYEDDDWGLIPLYRMPMIYNYKTNSLNDFLRDIQEINKQIEKSMLVNDEFKLPRTEGFGNTGNKISPNLKVKKTDIIRDMIAMKLQIEYESVYLNTKEFSNLLFINKAKE